jgi:hypothetical protein
MLETEDKRILYIITHSLIEGKKKCKTQANNGQISYSIRLACSTKKVFAFLLIYSFFDKHCRDTPASTDSECILASGMTRDHNATPK